jgi:predicted phage terminase large subunit-like protein
LEEKKKMEVNQTEYRALLRQDFSAFIQRCFHHLNPQTEFLPNWHIEVIAAKLEACRQGKIRRLIINVPPRHLKSLCASVALPAWTLGHDPTAQILCVSYAQDLADKLARDCRSVITSPWYKPLFPTAVSAQKQAVSEFVTARQGYRLATSVGGVLTGRGADMIIIDDPLKPDEALSEAQRRTVNNWYDNTLYSRLNDKRRGCIIIIMQRLHEDDLVGHVLEQEKWDVVSFPAIAEQDEEHLIATPFGTDTFRRRAGEVLHSEREPRETLDRIRRTIGEYHFAGQYQQAPAPMGGGLIKAEWFKHYEIGELPGRFDQVVQSWDTANKVTELSDYSVCSTWGISDKRIYLLDVLRRRMNYPDLKRAVRDQAQEHRATLVLIEDKASGTQLIQELVAEGLRVVKGCAPDHDKVMRLNAQTATIANGYVYLPDQAPWLAAYLHELTTFPYAKYDDQADSTSQALAWINLQPPEPSGLTWVRQELARQLHQEGLSLPATAARVGATPQEVQRWFDEDEQYNDELIEIYEDAMRKRCTRCGEKLYGTYDDAGGYAYHPQCWTLTSSGK